MTSEVKPGSDACSSQPCRSRRSGRPGRTVREDVSASNWVSLVEAKPPPNWKLKLPCESVWVSVRFWPLQTVWIEADSVRTLPSSNTALPERKIIGLEDRLGGGFRGRGCTIGPTPRPPPRVCAGAGRNEMDIRQARARRLFMMHPTREELCSGLYAQTERPIVKVLSWRVCASTSLRLGSNSPSSS